MTEEEWLDGLRHLGGEEILQAHFSLQEQIKNITSFALNQNI